MRKRILLLLFPGILLLGLLLAASLRYDGPAGLVRRLRSEIVSLRAPAHPLLVPTPLPTPTAVSSPARTPTPLTLPSPTPSPTLVVPTALPTPEPEPTSTISADLYQPARTAVALTGLRHAWQTWNNCGPATLAMQLSYFGSTLDQEAVRLVLRPHPDDKNVNPTELAQFAVSQGFSARVLVNGSDDRLRLLLSNGLPVLIETWLEPEPDDGMGHYRLLTGYDDAQRQWIAYDAYVSAGVARDAPYQGIRLPYDEVAELWRVFNRTYVLVYRPEQETLVRSILGADADETLMWEAALAAAQAELSSPDAFAWFNLGSALTALGRYDEATAAYDQARLLGLPWRMLWYQFGPFQAYTAVGRHEEVLRLADATLATTTNIEELHLWRGRALAVLGQTEAARQAFVTGLAIHPDEPALTAALAALP